MLCCSRLSRNYGGGVIGLEVYVVLSQHLVVNSILRTVWALTMYFIVSFWYFEQFFTFIALKLYSSFMFVIVLTLSLYVGGGGDLVNLLSSNIFNPLVELVQLYEFSVIG